MTLKVGLTGGIGSGKSLVAEVFARLGVPVYSADERGRWLLDHDEQVRNEVNRLFGNSIYVNNELDRKQVAGIVFANKGKLDDLNAIIHPAVAKDFSVWIRGHEGARYVLKETAILFETGLFEQTDRTILVTAPKGLRSERVMKRDHVSEDNVRARMANQWEDEQKMELADLIIDNSGKQMVVPQVLRIHEELILLNSYR